VSRPKYISRILLVHQPTTTEHLNNFQTLVSMIKFIYRETVKNVSLVNVFPVQGLLVFNM